MTNQTDNQPLTNVQPADSAPVLTRAIAIAPTQPEQPKQHRRWGRIPRLPTKSRLAINQAMREGSTYEQIQQQLVAEGHAHITYDNLANWYQTGYQDWLRDQEQFEERVLLMDSAQSQKTPSAKKKDFRDLSQLDIAVLLRNAAREFNLEKIREQLDGKPDAFFRLVHANALHERNAILRDRTELEIKKYAAAKKQKRAVPKKKALMTAEKLEQIKARLNIM